jgi:lysophospholipase L1-like esterase
MQIEDKSLSMKIVFLGDSLTWGEYGGNFLNEVASQMPEAELINAGVAGDTVVNLLRRIDPILEEEADAIFVMVGGNDATSYAMPDTRGYYRRAKKLENGMVTPEQFATAYEELLSKIQAHEINVFVGLAPHEYNKEMVKIKQEFNQISREIAEKLNVPVLDLDAVFSPANPIEREPIGIKFIQDIGANVAKGWNDFETERAKWGYTYTFDGIHILPETAIKFANHIVPFLKKHL